MPTKQILDLLRQARAEGVRMHEDRERNCLVLQVMRRPSDMLVTILQAHKWELILYLRDLEVRGDKFMARLKQGVESDDHQ